MNYVSWSSSGGKYSFLIYPPPHLSGFWKSLLKYTRGYSTRGGKIRNTQGSFHLASCGALGLSSFGGVAQSGSSPLGCPWPPEDRVKTPTWILPEVQVQPGLLRVRHDPWSHSCCLEKQDLGLTAGPGPGCESGDRIPPALGHTLKLKQCEAGKGADVPSRGYLFLLPRSCLLDSNSLVKTWFKCLAQNQRALVVSSTATGHQGL